VKSPPSPLPTPPDSTGTGDRSTAAPTRKALPRGKSLQDRVKESRMIKNSDSTENFAKDIGWSHVYKSLKLNARVDSWRWSGISTTSTVEAIVVDADTSPQNQQRLRHSRKNPSLRSTSSPLPASRRSSLFTNPNSSRRLVHKRGRITDQTRWSMSSEASGTVGGSSHGPVHHRPYTVHTTTISELKRSENFLEDGYRRRSASLSTTSTSHHPTARSNRSHVVTHLPLRKQRPMSFTSPGGGFSSESRGRAGQDVSDTLPGAISYSAPASRSHSRATSSTSEHLRLRRLAAEDDLHRTLERMESENSYDRYVETSHLKRASNNDQTKSNSGAVDVLSPWSSHAPFAALSMESTSPGIVETGEARVVSLFPHNNHSLQIVDQSRRSEPRTVPYLQQSHLTDQRVPSEGASTPRRTSLPQLLVRSPLRNPREPPSPPALQVIPPTPLDMVSQETGSRRSAVPSSRVRRNAGSISRRFSSMSRPLARGRHSSESFMKTLTRSLSLRSARNVRGHQPLDAHLHPFWKPRGFWDDITDSDSDVDDDEDDDGGGDVVRNSLGVPQQRTIIDGPISLVRQISIGSRRKGRARGVTKSKSSSHPQGFRSGPKSNGQKLPVWAQRFPSLGLGHRSRHSSRQREGEEREMERQALRQKIGHPVLSTGDSRFPTYTNSFAS
jgi:hypothetical protein